MLPHKTVEGGSPEWLMRGVNTGRWAHFYGWEHLNYAGIQHQKYESSHGTTKGEGLCGRSSSILDKSPLENGGPILSLGDTL